MSGFAGGLERVKGIEPSSSAWKAVALPLSYTRRIRFPSLPITRRLYSLLRQRALLAFTRRAFPAAPRRLMAVAIRRPDGR